MKEKFLPVNFWNTFVTIFAFFFISLTSWYCLAFLLITTVEAVISAITLELDWDTSMVLALELLVGVTVSHLEFFIGTVMFV